MTLELRQLLFKQLNHLFSVPLEMADMVMDVKALGRKPNNRSWTRPKCFQSKEKPIIQKLQLQHRPFRSFKKYQPQQETTTTSYSHQPHRPTTTSDHNNQLQQATTTSNHNNQPKQPNATTDHSQCTWATSGPPESPWHASIPSSPAQIIVGESGDGGDDGYWGGYCKYCKYRRS